MQPTNAQYPSPVHFQDFLSETYQKITNNVKNFELINPLQLGFRKGVSTANALFFFHRISL